MGQAVLVRFGGLVALDEVTLDIPHKQLVGLIGPNGAGKTTFINVASGFQPTRRGRVFLDGQDVTRWSVEKRARHGLCRTFQGIRVFGALSVLENVAMGAVGTGSSLRHARTNALDLLDRVGLADEALLLAGALPHGKRRLLGLARVLATHPRYVLLDEPAAGLDEDEVDELGATLAAIRDEFEVAFLVVEHDMRLVMSLCEWIFVLDHGRLIGQGSPETVQRDPAVLSAYLGASCADERHQE